MTRHQIVVLLAVLIVLAFLFGAVGAPHAWGAWGWSPAGLFIAILIVVLLVG